MLSLFDFLTKGQAKTGLSEWFVPQSDLYLRKIHSYMNEINPFQ